MTAEDIMAMKAMSEGTDMSSYEHFMVAEKSAKRASGTSIAAITIGSAALLTGIGAWIFGGVYSAGRADANQQLIAANADHARQMEAMLAGAINAERSERVTDKATQYPTLNDYITLSQTQSSAQNASASSNAIAQAEATLLTQSLLGNVQSCPQKISLYSAPQPCPCPGSCG